MPKANTPEQTPASTPQDPDSAILSGTPFDGDPAAAEAGKAAAPVPAPSKTKVSIGGQEFEVDSDLAGAISAFQEEVRVQISSAAPAPTPAPSTKKQQADEPYDYATGIFVEPEVALARLREEIKAEMRAEYQADKGQKEFWSDFYKSNPDLKDMDFLTEAVLNKNYARLKDMEVEKAGKELAKLTREAASKIGVGRKKDDVEEPSRAVVEGASHPAPKHNVQNTEPGVTSLSDVIKQRQAAKRKAAS